MIVSLLKFLRKKKFFLSFENFCFNNRLKCQMRAECRKNCTEGQKTHKIRKNYMVITEYMCLVPWVFCTFVFLLYHLVCMCFSLFYYFNLFLSYFFEKNFFLRKNFMMVVSPLKFLRKKKCFF